MTWLIDIIIFIAGMATGLIAVRFIPQISGKTHKLSEELAEHVKAQESFKQDVDSYLASVNQAMQQIAQQATQAANESQQQFSKLAATQKEHKEFVPFFGDDTAAIMAQSQAVESANKTKIDSHSEELPRDYSENKMGWFSEQNQK
ncbi:hypothetical protein DS2_08330 [Catenovulum agarivorans DS-2]|uniref:DUF1043 family protein n=1 Tax=Catenovulum agarivorans DS-2 TaxID=1328313 RepID=W7QMU7_9ALTE|nr:DUF1043 family protein [Catenovulum agarivorans]EWH10267.1 hypothetical protein DS2_08330 [Catenovulum agarivorans DS-2]